MADLTKDAYLKIWGEADVDVWVLDNSAAQTVYKGQPIIIDGSADTVYVRGYVDATTVAATDVFIGIACHGAVVATTDTETDNTIQVYTGRTIVGIPGSTFTDADVGKTMYMSDSATLSSTAADNPQIGTLFKVEDGFQYVRLTAPQVCAGA